MPLASQGVDLSVVASIPMVVRAILSFALTVLFGGIAIYRYGDRIDPAVEASRTNPFLAVVYGLIAYGLVTFFVVYAYSELARLGLVSPGLLALGVAVLAVLLLSLGGFGFVVVGAWVSGLLWRRDLWYGLLGVGAVGASVWLFLPFVLAVVVWLSIAAVGNGGLTRKWIHHSAEPNPN